jgi:hypothetical protein
LRKKLCQKKNLRQNLCQKKNLRRAFSSRLPVDS